MLPDHTVTALLVQEHRERLAEMAARTPSNGATRAAALRRGIVALRFRLAGIPAPAVSRGTC